MKTFYKQRILGGGIVLVLLVICIVFLYRQSSLQEDSLQLSQADIFRTQAGPDQKATATPISEPLPTEILEYPTPENPGIVVTAPPALEHVITQEPIPTVMPTPAVTPVPVSSPPFIEGIEAQGPKPFWLYWAQGDEVWRIDGLGEDTQLVVNSLAATGQHLAGPPSQGSDCCIVGPVFSLAPDQQKLALTTLDPALIDPNNKLSPENYATALHIYDIEKGVSQSLGPGVLATWAPDSQQIAFLREGGLWVANGETGQPVEYVKPKVEEGVYVVSYAWSPDSTKLAFLYAAGQYSWLPSIWVISLEDGNEPKLVLSRENDNFGVSIIAPTWSPDGKSIYYLSSENEGYSSYGYQNLWKVSVEDGAVQPLTTGMIVSFFGFLPTQQWLYISGVKLYEYRPGEDTYHDIWLLNSANGALRRLTSGKHNSFVLTHTPEGANLLITNNTSQLQIISLADGTITPLAERLESSYVYGGGK